METRIKKIKSKKGCIGCHFFVHFQCVIPEEIYDYKCVNEDKIWIEKEFK